MLLLTTETSAPMAAAVNLVGHPVGWLLLLMFVVGYYVIAAEERYRLDKAKTALFLGTTMFAIIGGLYVFEGWDLSPLTREVDHLILEIAEIFFFLLVAMVYIETLIERGVFAALRNKLIAKGYSYRQLFWLTGLLTFFISAVADNLTTALIFATVIASLSRDARFVVPAAVNIVVASNAGGVWSPFGDITTLMVWAAGKASFFEFLALFPAGFIGWVVTALLLVRSVPDEDPLGDGDALAASQIKVLEGGYGIVALGVLTIVLSVVGKQVMHLPPMWGMLLGLALLQLYGYLLNHRRAADIDVFAAMSRIENNTLLFFFGILAAVGALHFAGFLGWAAQGYAQYSHTGLNVGVGLLSALIDNVPVMSAVLKANPDMNHAQWMLVTLTAGIGGSLISFGSAAGVGVMGKLHGVYTFASHLRHAWTIAVGFAVSIAVWWLQFADWRI